MRVAFDLDGKWLALALLGVGFGIGWLTGHKVQIPVAHAQEQSSIIGSCSLTIPKEWGEYKGASDWGLAFQDEQGNLRFLRHTRCDIAGGNSDPKSNDWELMIHKK